LPAYLWAAIIFVESSIPGHKFPETPFGSDKVAHAGIFFILCWLVYRALKHQTVELVSKMSLFLAVVVTILYGFTDEFHQLYVPGRSADMFDMAADALGGFLFIVFVVVHQFVTEKTGQANP
jgi:VanZ family protein